MPKIIYNDLPLGANEKATYTASQQQTFTELSAIKDDKGVTAKVTPEINYWQLDGNFTLLENNASGYGLYSLEIADSNGNFENNPIIEINLDDVYTATGLSFVFDTVANEYPAQMHIDWYFNKQKLREMTVDVTSANFTIPATVESFNRVVIEFLKGTPNRFLKVNRLVIGQITTLSDDELVSVNIVNDIDPISAELRISTLNFTLNDKQNRSFVFQERQAMSVFHDNEIQGIFYFDTANKTAQNKYEISAINRIGILDKGEFLGGIYNKKNVLNLLQEVVGSDFEVELDSSFDGVTVTGYLPIGTKREILSQIAFSTGAMVTTFGTEKIKFEPLSSVTNGNIKANEIFYGRSVKQSSPLSQVTVYAHGYEKGTTAKQVYKGVASGNMRTTFKEPYSDYSITNGTINSSGANYVDFTAYGEEVVITAIPYEHSTQVYTKRNEAVSQTNNDNSYSIENATLVNSFNAESVLERVYDYYKNRETLSQSIVMTTQRAGQYITSVKPFDSNIKGYITKMDIRYTARHRTADIEIYGSRVELPSVWKFSGTEYSGGNFIYYG